MHQKNLKAPLPRKALKRKTTENFDHSVRFKYKYSRQYKRRYLIWCLPTVFVKALKRNLQEDLFLVRIFKKKLQTHQKILKTESHKRFEKTLKTLVLVKSRKEKHERSQKSLRTLVLVKALKKKKSKNSGLQKAFSKRTNAPENSENYSPPQGFETRTSKNSGPPKG